MAIWREEKIIVLIAKGVWVADLAFLIIGEYFLPIIKSISYKPGDITGCVRVKISKPPIFNLLGLSDNRSFVIRGRTRATPATSLTQRAQDLILLAR